MQIAANQTIRTSAVGQVEEATNAAFMRFAVANAASTVAAQTVT